MAGLRESFADVAPHLARKQPYKVINSTRQGFRCNVVVVPYGCITGAENESERTITELEKTHVVVPTRLFRENGGKELIMAERALPIPSHMEDIAYCVMKDFKQDVAFPPYGRICGIIASHVKDDCGCYQSRYRLLHGVIAEYVQMVLVDRDVAVAHRETIHLAWSYFFRYACTQGFGNAGKLIEVSMQHVNRIIDLEDGDN